MKRRGGVGWGMGVRGNEGGGEGAGVGGGRKANLCFGIHIQYIMFCISASKE